MKKFGTLIFALFLISCSESNHDPKEATIDNDVQEEIYLKKGSLLGFHFVDTLTEADPQERHLFLREQYFPTWRDLMPNSRVYFLQGERGINKNRSCFFWVFKDQKSRDFLFPEKDAGTPEYDIRRKSVDWLYTDTTFYKYAKGWVDSLSADYLVISSGAEVKQDWLKSGALIGLHHMKLKAGVDTGEFEKFIEDTWAPNRSDAVPDSKVFFLKGIRGDFKDEYAFMWVIDSKPTRDKYYPKPDEASDLYNALKKNWEWLYTDEHRGKYLDGWLSEKQNDYIVI